MLDITKPDQQRELLERELEAVGIRLNRGKPDVTVKQKTGGGITINATVPMTKTDERTIRAVLQSYKREPALNIAAHGQCTTSTC